MAALTDRFDSCCLQKTLGRISPGDVRRMAVHTPGRLRICRLPACQKDVEMVAEIGLDGDVVVALDAIFIVNRDSQRGGLGRGMGEKHEGIVRAQQHGAEPAG